MWRIRFQSEDIHHSVAGLIWRLSRLSTVKRKASTSKKFKSTLFVDMGLGILRGGILEVLLSVVNGKYQYGNSSVQLARTVVLLFNSRRRSLLPSNMVVLLQFPSSTLSFLTCMIAVEEHISKSTQGEELLILNSFSFLIKPLLLNN